MNNYDLSEKYILIKKELLKQTSTNPIEIVNNIMNHDFVNMHGPEHHFIDGASFLVALKNSGEDIDINSCLDQLAQRTKTMPGAMCGYWGICGSCASVGAALSIIFEVGPLSSNDYYSYNMKFTSNVINKMSNIGGPRCCKRNAYLVLSEAVKFVNENFNYKLTIDDIKCNFSNFNKQCIKNRCPFHQEKK
ncbi:MAG: DUF5714 domain-containing protein [Bacilli bacterium]